MKLISNQEKYSCVRENFILAVPLQASLNAHRLKHIIRLEELDESRGQSRSSGIFHEQLTIHRVCLYPNGFRLHKLAYNAALSELCLYKYYNIEFTKCKCVLQYCNNCTSLFFPEKEKRIMQHSYY